MAISTAELKLKLERQYKILVRLMQTPDGKQALECLQARYSGNIHVPGDPYATHVRVGERGVVDFLKQLSEGEPTNV